MSTNIKAKYKRQDVDSLIGNNIEFKYKGDLEEGILVKTDFNKNFEMAYGVVTIKEKYITFTTGIENVNILNLNNV